MVDKQIQQFMGTFLGFGTLNSPYWFVGKEEGGKRSREEIISRVKRWDGFGRPHTVECFALDHLPEHVEKWSRNEQPTWAKLIQVLQVLEYGETNNNEIVRYQVERLGRNNGNHCLLELMPMPTKDVKTWNYNELFPSLPELQSREIYMKTVAPRRVDLLKKLVREYQPKLVMFYSSSGEYCAYWSQISGSTQWVRTAITRKFKVAFFKAGNTLYVVTPHPARHGITKDDFALLGKQIRRRLEGHWTP